MLRLPLANVTPMKYDAAIGAFGGITSVQLDYSNADLVWPFRFELDQLWG